MKNHFFLSWVGNKWNERDNVINNLDLTDINTIIEPFCGSCAISIQLSILYPKRFKYILNDLDSKLIEIFNIIKNNKWNDIVEEYNKLDQYMNKEDYYKIIDNNDIIGYILGHRHYQFRINYPPTNKKLIKLNNSYKFIDFILNEDVELHNKQAIDIINEYKNDNNVLLYLDPPYIKTRNIDFYDNANKKDFLGIYNYLEFADITTRLYLNILRNDDLIRKYMNRYELIYEYSVKYKQGKERNKKHIILSNHIINV